jgi:non-canonical (house-cleaning) NTP pyrophosphatase
MSESKLNPAKIDAVVEFVRKNPGCTKIAAAASVSKQPSYGYRFVQGAIDQGKIAAERDTTKIGRPYSLNLTAS